MLKMRRATENQGDTRALTEYYSHGSKVKDLVFQPHSRSHFAPFAQETPMKPSQLPNRLSHPPPRRMLPLQSPELCHTDRQPQHPHHFTGPVHSSGFVPNSSTNVGSQVTVCHPMERDRLQHQQRQTPGFFHSQWSAPFRPMKSCTAPSMPQSVSPFLPSSHQLMRDLSNQSPSFPIRKDQGTESKSTSSHTGSKNVTAEGKVSNKEDQSGVKSSLQTIQLHRPPVTTSVYPRGGQEGCSLPLVNENGRPENSALPSRYYLPSQCTQSSDKSSGLLVLHKPAAHCQDQPHKKTPHISVECESRKRHREFEGCDDSPKKQCVPGINSGTAKSTDGNSLLPQPSSSSSSVLEPSAKTPNGHLCTEPACGRSDVPDQSSCTSLKLCPKKRPPMGAKQAFMKFNQSDTLTLSEVKSSSKDRSEDSLKKRSNSHNNRDKSSSFLSSEDNMTTPHVHLSGHPHRSTSVSPVSTLCRGGPTEESRRSDTSKSGLKSNAGSSGFRAAERHKTARSRRPVVIPNDIEELFTPDRKTYVVCSSDKAAKSNTDGHKSSTLEKSCVSNSVTCSGATITESSCHKTASPYTVRSEVSSSLSAHHPQVTMPNVILERVNLKDFKFRRLTNYPDTSSGRQLKDERVKSEERRTALLQNNVRPSALETTTTTSCSSSLTERRRSETDRKLVNEEDPIDVELDLGLSFAVDLDLTQSSHSSEDEQLISLQEMMERVAKPPPGTPEKGAFSAPSTPGHRNCQSKTEPLQTSKNSGIYKNSLDQMLKEINTNKRAKEVETQLLTACKEDLLRIAEYEEAEENRDEGISTEQQEFLRRYSLMCNAIKEVPPGEAVFNLEKFGRLFNHNTLQLRHCMVTPQGTAQKTLLWLPSGQTTFLGPPLERSSPAQLKLHLNIGLFQDAYSCPLPCPDQVTCFLFKMMSVHSERMVSEKILQALCDIACSSASQAVKSGSQQFKVWVPTLSEVTLVLMNMGVAFVTLFPFESLQPPFTEGDLLENISIKSESPSNNEDQRTFPEHNCNCVLKYLSYCIGLCPRAYSDDHLLLLLTVVGKISLDTQVILQSSMDLNPLLYKIVNNIRDWDTVLPRICRALTDLTDDHHNMCMLAQLLPDSTRGKQLRRHLSLSMISKLLDGKCTYRPSENDFQLRELRPYLPRMQPSTLLRNMLSSSSRSQVDQEEDMAALDQQSYYLCYSLLTLANEASNFQFFPAHQKEELLSLSTELETHIKCDIRESEKCLYRSKVKDLVARMYTKWQMLLQRTRPLNGKLYDYWQPSQLEALTSSQEEQEMDISNDGEGAVMEEDGEEDTSETEEILMTIEDKEKGEEDKPIDYMTERDMKPEEMEEDVAMDDTKEPKEETEAVIQVHSQIKAGGSD